MKRTEVSPKNVSSEYTLVFFHNLTELWFAQTVCLLQGDFASSGCLVKFIALKLKTLFKLVKTTYIE